jgi:hypothetical protein
MDQQQVNQKSNFPAPKRLAAVVEKALSERTAVPTEMAIENDSLLLAIMLRKSLRIAKQHLSDSTYYTRYKTPFEDWVDATVTVEIGYQFSPTYRHLIIHREVPWGMIQDIYLVQDGNLRHVLQHETAPLCFIRDSITDINGDSFNDFFVHWYPSSGCCERNVYDVYLFRERNGTFCPKKEFMNPIFFPEQRLIRGMEYGHDPGYYTYKWRGFQIDTIERVYPNPDDPQQASWIRSNRSLHSKGRLKNQVITTFPDYYKSFK